MRSVVTMRLEPEVVEGLRAWAKLEGRTLANLVESFWRSEVRRREFGEVTLDVIDGKLDRLLEQQKATKVRKKTKRSAYDIDTGDVVSEEKWKAWIDHLHRSDVHLNHYRASLQFEILAGLAEDDWDTEHLIDELIAQGAMKIYLPFEWKKGH